jgi:hypothetical protein
MAEEGRFKNMKEMELGIQALGQIDCIVQSLPGVG